LHILIPAAHLLSQHYVEIFEPAGAAILSCGLLGRAHGSGGEGTAGRGRIVMILLLGEILGSVYLKTLTDVEIRTLVVEEAEVALAS